MELYSNKLILIPREPKHYLKMYSPSAIFIKNSIEVPFAALAGDLLATQRSVFNLVLPSQAIRFHFSEIVIQKK